MDENSENQNEQAEVKAENVKVGNFKYYTPPEGFKYYTPGEFEYFKTEDEKAEDEAKIRAAEIKAAEIKAKQIKAEAETATIMKQCMEKVTELTGEVEKLKAEVVKTAPVRIEKMTDGFEAYHDKCMEELAKLKGDIEDSRAKNIKAVEEIMAKHEANEAAETAGLVARIRAEDEHAASTRAALVARMQRLNEHEETFARLSGEIGALNAGRDFIGKRRL